MKGEQPLETRDVLETIRAVASRVTEGRGFDLVDIEIKRERGGHLVRLYVDREGGISLDDLQSVSEEVSAILDVEDPIETSYTLEVSSPGLDRPFQTEADYRRARGRLVKLTSEQGVDGRKNWVGRLLAVEDGVATVKLLKEKGAEVQVPIAKVSHGRLEPEFKKGDAS